MIIVRLLFFVKLLSLIVHLYSEIVLSASYFAEHRTIAVKEDLVPIVTRSSASPSAASLLPLLNMPHFYLSIILSTALLVVYCHHPLVDERFSLKKEFAIISDWLNEHAVITRPQIVSDAFGGFLSWSLTYLFIRRLPNPENGFSWESLRKFSSDAFFGGLAAAACVFLKNMITVHIHGKSS